MPEYRRRTLVLLSLLGGACVRVRQQSAVMERAGTVEVSATER